MRIFAVSHRVSRWLGGLALAAVVAASMLGPRAFARGPESVADIAEGLQDAVVNISTSQSLKGQQGGVPIPKVPKGSPFEEFFNDFFNQQQEDGARQVSSLGSGFVVDATGLVVTNNHVIESADEIVVNFNDGSKLKVEKVLGRDAKTDIALLQVRPKQPLKAAKFGDSAKLRVGDWVMAIGNPFGLGGTVTVGVISAKKRDINAGPYDEFLQTDAAINRGNSGGPLFNMEGEVIGVNTAIISPTGGSIGIGFAVPGNTVGQIIEQLKQFGEARRGWLGVHIQTVSDEIADGMGLPGAKGALIASTQTGSPAAEAGIEAGDVIVKFDGQDVANMRELPKIVAGTPIGKVVDVEIIRRGQPKTVKITVGRLPEDTASSDAATPSGEEKEIEPEAGQNLLGLSIFPLTDELRERFGIGKKVAGVVVMEVDPQSVAAQKEIRPGDVIVEVTQEEVKTPAEVVSRVDAVRKQGRKSVLLLISDAKGDLRFVAVPVEG